MTFKRYRYPPHELDVPGIQVLPRTFAGALEVRTLDVLSIPPTYVILSQWQHSDGYFYVTLEEKCDDTS